MLVARRSITFTATGIRNYRVTVLGAATELGKTLSLILRAQPSIKKLVMHDNLGHNPGIVMDLSHIPASTSVEGYTGEESLHKALNKSDLIISVGASKTPDMTKEDWLGKNVEYIKNIAPKIAKMQPLPFFGIVAEPINSIVPMAAEIMRLHGGYNGKKLFGISTIDTLRAQCLYADQHNLSPRDCSVPVIGGRSETTLIPLLSQATPRHNLTASEIQEFTTYIRKCDENVMRGKCGVPPSLSVAFGVLLFVRSILEALDGKPGKVNAFVENNDFGTSFFSGLVAVDNTGAKEMTRYNNLSPYECQLLEQTIEQLRKDVSYGRKLLEYA